MTTFCLYPSGTVTVSAVLGSTAVNRRPRAALPLPLPFPVPVPVAASAVAAAAGGAVPSVAAVPAAVATETTAAALITERRLSALAMTSPT